MPQAGAIRAGRAFVELFADDSKLVRGLKRAQAKLMAFGKGIRNLGLKIAGLGAAMLAPLLGAAKAFSSMGDQVAKMAKRTGLSVEALSEMRFVASQTGTEFESLEMGFRRMQRSIYDAGRGLSTAADALADLGLRFEDLDGLSPEEQFKLLGEALSRIEDPTKKAAIAMTLFGRTGTNLLPMFALGVKGIEELQEEARRLGLTMSSEDAKAAEDFTDALDKLWKVVKMGVFRLGAALAPVLQKLTDTISGVAVKISAWIDQNRQLIVTVLKVAVAIVAGGIALAALGTIISGLGSALGVLITIMTGVAGVFNLLAGVIAFLLSPIGAVITAVVALGVSILHATGAGAKALGWLAGRFEVLREDAVASYQGIADALAAGDIALAAKILWLTLKMEWTRGINFLEKAWLNFRTFFIQIGVDAWHGLLAAVEVVWHSLQVGWIETTAFLSKTWTQFTGWVQRAWQWTGRQLAKAWNFLRKQFDSSFDADAANRAAEEFYQSRKAQIEMQTGQAIADREAQRQSDREKSARDHEEAMAEIGRENLEKHRELDNEYQRRIAENEADLARARNEWQDALAKARRKRAAREAAGPEEIEGPEDLLNKVRSSLSGLGDLLETARERTINVIGTFNASALLGLQAGSADDRIANATERTAKGIDGLRLDVRNNRAAFS